MIEKVFSTQASHELPRLLASALIGAGLIAACVGCRPRAAASREASLELIAGEQGRGPGEMQFPRAVAVDRDDGRFWVVDRLGRIQLFSSTGEPLALWTVPETEYGAPVGIHLDRDGTLLVMDSHYQRVRRYTVDGKEQLASFGAKGKGIGQFTFGRDVVSDSAGYIYTGDYGGDNDRVQKFTAAGEFVREWGRQGVEPGEFHKMQGMAIELVARDQGPNEEFLLVVDQCNHRVQRFDLDGNFVSSFGSLGSELGNLRFPSGVAVGRDGSIYVSEWGNNRVQKFDPDGNSLGSWGGPGDRPGELKTPWDVEIGPDDLLYVADYGNHRVQVFRFEATGLTGR